jgi:hypothetical protein
VWSVATLPSDILVGRLEGAMRRASLLEGTSKKFRAREKAKCAVCGGVVFKRVAHQKYCGQRCRTRAWEARHPRVTLTAVLVDVSNLGAGYEEGDEKPLDTGGGE